MRHLKIPFLGVILSLLAVTENGQTLLSDPYREEMVSTSAQSSNLELEGATAEARGSGCHFKETFMGSWFQSGIHHAITITRDGISTKGHCVEREGEKYLMYNRRDNCYRCLVFSEKHLNVLQYKETFCIPEREKRSLRQICSTITGDANLYALFRLEASPIDCPFKGQFTVSYNRGGGDCTYPPSSLESCTKSSKIVFNFQACADIPSESSVEELQCLAAWKEGSSRFFLGLITYQHHASYEERFRCFVYERSSKHGRGGFGHSHSHSTSPEFHSHSLTNSSGVEQIYRVAMSGDATCNGLSANEGSRTMVLRKVPAVKGCQFPSWLVTPSPWHTLDQGSTYTFLSGNLRISNFSELAGTGPNSLTMTGLCHQLLGVGPSLKANMAWERDYDPTSVVILHATSECKNGYVCTAFHQRDDNIMEIQFGTIARRAEDACQLSHFSPTLQPYTTLVSSSPQRISCPNVGHFQVNGGLAWNGKKVVGEKCKDLKSESLEDDDEEKEEEDGTKDEKNSMAVGCSSPDKIKIRVKSQCDNMETDYSCHGWWSDTSTGITYVVTSRSSSHQSFRPQRHCFAFRDLSWSWKPEKQLLSTSSLEDSSDDNVDGQLDPSNNNNGREPQPQLLEFSSFADSCQRNVRLGREGDFAFNLTRIGHCSDINGAPSPGRPHHILALYSIATSVSLSLISW